MKVHYLSALLVLAWGSLAHAAPPTGGFTAIAVRNVNGLNTERGAPDPPSLAIDGNFNTSTYLTVSNTGTVGQRVYLDLGAPTDIYGFRWSKTDAYVDPHDLSFLTSTDAVSISLLSRSFTAVSNLQNGYQGTELVNGTFSGNSIAGESDGGGFYSVTFNHVLTASAIRFDFKSTGSFDHYHVNEFQAIVPEPRALGWSLEGSAS